MPEWLLFSIFVIMKAQRVIKYPVGVQSFESIREGEYLYVDKTKYIYDLVMSGKSYFLSRPRRFGKSLLLSTIEAFFKGRRDLFEGLHIADTDWEWIEYPVLHLDLSIQNYRNREELDQILSNALDVWENRYDICHDHRLTVSIRFSNLLRNIAEKCGRKVVIYNPFSILNAFDKKNFGDYWFGSGTPTMLVELLKSKSYVLSKISGCRCREGELAGSDVFLDNPIPILYQSGYLTIKGYDERFGEFILDYPNREVREGFVNFLAPFYLPPT